MSLCGRADDSGLPQRPGVLLLAFQAFAGYFYFVAPPLGLGKGSRASWETKSTWKGDGDDQGEEWLADRSWGIIS